MRFTLLFLLILCGYLPSMAQEELSTRKKKAIEAYIQADNFRVRGQFEQAERLLKEALEKDDDFFEAWFRLGLTYKMSRQYEKAAGAYHQAINHNPKKKPLTNVYFELGEIYQGLGDYEKSQEYLEMYLASNPRNRNKLRDADRLLSNAKYAIDNAEEIAAVELTKMSETVNKFQMQYFPVLTADKKALIYTRRLSAFQNAPNSDEDLVISRINANGEWSEPESLSDNINTEQNEGTNTISADGRTLIFTSCDGRQSFGSCDLFISYKEGDQWSVPVNMGSTINSRDWDSQPSLSADGRTLFFVSYRPGGQGKEDIWYAKLGSDGKWSAPLNAGAAINTSGSDISPFLHANGRTLFFSSDGHKGFGGLDVFKSEWSGGQKFSEPENVGAPINTAADQISVFITADGEDGYFSHESYSGSIRQSFIYTFKVPEKMRPAIITNYVTGVVTEKESKKPLKASIELIDVQKNELINLVYSDSVTGEYLIVLPEGSQYALYVNKEGYLFENKSFNYIEKHKLDPVIFDFQLQKANKGASVVLNNIFFDFDSYKIREESLTELEKIISFLKRNPKISIEIAGHTDDKGSEDYNLRLSEQRAKAVFDYLISKGIAQKQIGYKGYGQQKPLVPNNSDSNRQVNRRIEFQIK